MSKYVNDLLAAVRAQPESDMEADPLAAYAAVVKQAKHVGKTPVEQEFPGLASIGLLPHFMMPGLIFYHEPTGYIIYGGLTLVPGLCPLGPEWMAIPMVVRYTATQRFTPELAIEAMQATYLQSVVLPKFGAKQLEDGSHMHSMRVVMADAGDAHEIADGIFETYGLLCMESGIKAAKATIESFNSIIYTFNQPFN